MVSSVGTSIVSSWLVSTFLTRTARVLLDKLPI